MHVIREKHRRYPKILPRTCPRCFNLLLTQTSHTHRHASYTISRLLRHSSWLLLVGVFQHTDPILTFAKTGIEGEMVQVVEEDDGSGWVKVADSAGGKGLVPATYVDIVEEPTPTPAQKKAPPPPVPRGSKPKPLGSGKYGALRFCVL